MNLRQIYEKAVRTGMERDPRGVAKAKAALAEARKEYEGLKEAEKPYFDLERLSNPYEDTRIINGPEDRPVKTVMVGIDIAEGELLLCDRLNERGRGIDAVVSHHPVADALAGLASVMAIQPGIYADAGVPIAQAEGVVEPRIKEVSSRIAPVNLQRAADAARLLGLPLASLHTVADNCVATHLTDLINAEKPEKLGDLMDLLHAIPEYDQGRRGKVGPSIVCGSKSSTTGRVLLEMTGGTEGAKEMYAKLARSSGVSTIVGMHFSKEHVDAARAENLNVVLAGHISSDNLGLNLLFDAVFRDRVEFVEVSGFRRVSRVKKAKSKV